jgi:hypothetical protein
MKGEHTVQTAHIRCTQLPHGYTTTIWAPYCACCSHIVPSASHMVPSASHMVPHGSHKPSNSCTVQLAPIWPPYGAFGSHMVPSTSCMAHRVSIWLTYGAGSSHTDHMAPIRCIQLTDRLHNWHHFGSHMAQNCSHMAPIHTARTQLTSGKQTAPIRPQYGAFSSHMLPSPYNMEQNGSHKPSTSHIVHTVPIWPTDGGTIHLPCSLHSFHMAPTWCQWLL